MKRLICGVLALALTLFVPVQAFAASHQAVLNWTASSDAVPSSTYSIFRASGACPAAPGTGFTLLASGVTGTTFTDTTITVGTWCYYVEQVQNGTNSAPSDLAGGTAAPLAPILQTVTVT
jgi:hypothetical protein